MPESVYRTRNDLNVTKLSEAAAILGKEGGKIGGKSKSPAKIAAARSNGELGGRPKVKNPSPATLAQRKRRQSGKV
jgi:hypothetical protein